MMETLLVLQCLSVIILFALLASLGALIAQQRRVARARTEPNACDPFLQELTLTADALIERYDTQRARLEECTRRIHEATARLETTPATARSPESRSRTRRAPESRAPASLPAGTSMTPAERELAQKLLRARGRPDESEAAAEPRGFRNGGLTNPGGH